jgi:hypothetical protein
MKSSLKTFAATTSELALIVTPHSPLTRTICQVRPFPRGGFGGGRAPRPSEEFLARGDADEEISTQYQVSRRARRSGAHHPRAIGTSAAGAVSTATSPSARSSGRGAKRRVSAYEINT